MFGMLPSMTKKRCLWLQVEMVCSKGGVWSMVAVCGLWVKEQVWLDVSGSINIRLSLVQLMVCLSYGTFVKRPPLAMINIKAKYGLLKFTRQKTTSVRLQLGPMTPCIRFGWIALKRQEPGSSSKDSNSKNRRYYLNNTNSTKNIYKLPR